MIQSLPHPHSSIPMIDNNIKGMVCGVSFHPILIISCKEDEEKYIFHSYVLNASVSFQCFFLRKMPIIYIYIYIYIYI